MGYRMRFKEYWEFELVFVVEAETVVEDLEVVEVVKSVDKGRSICIISSKRSNSSRNTTASSRNSV